MNEKNVEQNFNPLKVKGLIAEKGITQTELAKELNISITTLNLKLNGKFPFKSDEISKISNVFNVNASYFFN